MTQSLTLQDFQNAANSLGVTVAHIKAVTEVESAGGGFLADGRVKVQYEPHVMYRQLITNLGKAKADAALRQYPDLVSLKPGSYQSLDKEDKDMGRAVKLIDRNSALESASWGLFQIMGYHWKTCAYATLQEFINAQQTSAGQLDTFVRFIKADARLFKALKSNDWATFARIYNGPNYAANNYDRKLSAAFTKFGGKGA